MKFCVYIVLLILVGCGFIKENVVSNNQLLSKITIENRIYLVGDINNDKLNDTAYITYKRNVETDEVFCEANEINCFIDVKFNQNIPDLRFRDSNGIVVLKTGDFNNDLSNEIIIFSRIDEGWWNDVSIWSLKNNSWVMLVKTKAFISEEKDFNNRVVKIDDYYYLIGHNQFEEDINGNFTEIKIRIK